MAFIAPLDAGLKHQLLEEGALTSEALTAFYLDRISTHNPTLEMIDSLHKAPTEGVAPLQHPLEQNLQLLRADVVQAATDREELQAVAPAVSDGCYLVPKVIN